MLEKLFRISCVSIFILTFALPAAAVVPPPPANQMLGIFDGIFNNVDEAVCRFCHEDPNIVSGVTHIPNRHHLLVNSPMRTGICSVSSDTCLSDGDCNPGICSRNNVPCTVDSECPEFIIGETCGEICLGETVAPDTTDYDTAGSITYQCLNCHLVDTTGGIYTMLVWRDCTLCHIQIPGEASVHHLTPTAQGTDSPIGAPNVGDCTPCHGTLVDDIGDGHTIPSYQPSLVTPSPSGGDGLPLNNYGNGAGACDYCHDQETMPPADPIEIYGNADTHHNTGVFINEVGFVDGTKCFWCHQVIPPTNAALDIRVCEACHGFESLHNIQVDSDSDGVINVGGELNGYGHIGNNDDCWGCHGFLQANAPGTGPVTPYINSSNVMSMTAGTDTAVTLTGTAFTNVAYGYEWQSVVVLTAADGTKTELTPTSISENSLTVTIPASTATGNYEVRAVKGNTESNLFVISVIPDAVITTVDCNKKKGVLTVTGSGFSEKPEGTDEYIGVEVNGVQAELISWTDTVIKASVSRCSNKYTVTVNTLFGSAVSGAGKPPKPCKGKGCSK